jgi:hypothetical protein
VARKRYLSRTLSRDYTFMMIFMIVTTAWSGHRHRRNSRDAFLALYLMKTASSEESGLLP